MQIGIISDIHDNIWALESALTRVTDCEALLCLGDLCSPFTMAAVAEGFDGDVHVVWGNNDGDKLLLTRAADKAANVTLHGDVAEVEVGGRLIAMSHYYMVSKAMAQGDRYDLVCYGHSHRQDMSRHGKTTLLNPGEVMGRFGTHSIAKYDTESGKAEIIQL